MLTPLVLCCFCPVVVKMGLTANPRDTLAKLLTSSEAVARIYLLHLVELIEVFEDVIIITPRTERRFHGKIHWIRPDCA